MRHSLKGMVDAQSIPIVIVCRDQVSILRDLVLWLENSGYSNIILVDNNSTYPPLVDYLRNSPHRVIYHASNDGPYTAVWQSSELRELISDSFYVVTDSDVVPTVHCPGDAVGFLHWILERYPRHDKAGFGLRIDNIPNCYALAAEVRRWEGQFWTRPFGPNLFRAPIDTTFALYRPNSEFTIYPAVRTGWPYVAEHRPWYQDSSNPSDEERYYQQHCDERIASWTSQSVGLGTPFLMDVSTWYGLKWRVYRSLFLRGANQTHRFFPDMSASYKD